MRYREQFDGERHEVDRQVKMYFRRWPSHGYGTQITRTLDHGDGMVTVIVTRWASCD